MKVLAITLAFTWTSLWFTPDQWGQHLLKKGEYLQAAEAFTNPMQRGAALYLGKDFKNAQIAFSSIDSPEAHYNRGNCLAFQGKYEDAMAAYQRALDVRPDWQEAKDNLAIAKARAEALKQEGGENEDQEAGANEVKFDKKKPGGDDTTTEKEQQVDMQSLWLRRVNTSPADFLRLKFAYQLEQQQEAKK